MGKHHKNDGDNAPASRHVGLDYDNTNGGEHRPKAVLESGPLGTRNDMDGKSKGNGWDSGR